MNIKELLESRGHKILATAMRNQAAAKNQSNPDTQTTHTRVAPAADLTKSVKQDEPPFEPDAPKRNPSAIAGKSGIGHSVARHLARQGLRTMTKEETEMQENIVEGSGPYMLYDPKHPQFASNYNKFKRANPDKSLSHFVDAMKKKEHGDKLKEEVELVEAYLTESEKKLAKLAADIEKRKGLLDLAAEKRRMRKSSARHYQSPAEMNHAAKIRELEQKHDDLKKSMSEEVEQIDELSPGTLKSYRSKAIDSYARNNRMQTFAAAGQDYDDAEHYKRAKEKRRQGFNTAGKKLAASGNLNKEETEVEEQITGSHLNVNHNKYYTSQERIRHRKGTLKAAVAESVAPRSFHELRAQMAEQAVAPVEYEYYKGRKLHFARGNRGGKSSSSRGGPASDAGADAGGGNGGGNGD